jgi:hypothetical protein
VGPPDFSGKEEGMGANYVDMTLDGGLVGVGVHEKFAEAQNLDRYENGHCYSGGIGMASGLDLDHNLRFKTVEEAAEHVQERAKKWREAIGVFVEPDEKHKNGRWYIGAWCAS